MKQRRSRRDNRGHASGSANEKIDRDFPGPDRRLDHRLAIIAGLSWNRTANNVYPVARDDPFGCCLMPQLTQSLLARPGVHRKNPNATNADTRLAIAVAIAAVHADLR